MNKTYVEVDCVRSLDGTEKPSVIYWPDGHFWTIDRVLYVSEPNRHEFGKIHLQGRRRLVRHSGDQWRIYEE